jgi:hypothetical protein
MHDSQTAVAAMSANQLHQDLGQAVVEIHILAYLRQIE